MSGEFKGPKGETIIVGLLNTHDIKLLSTYLSITYRLVLLSAFKKPLYFILFYFFAVSDG